MVKRILQAIGLLSFFLTAWSCSSSIAVKVNDEELTDEAAASQSR